MLIYIYIIYIYRGLNKSRRCLSWILKMLFDGDIFLIVMWRRVQAFQYYWVLKASWINVEV